MEAFMEEVVGFVFHLEVEVTESPQAGAGVGVVTGADGRAVQIGAGRNGHDPHPSHLIESGPDPDDLGVSVHVLDDDLEETDVSDAEIDDEADEIAAAEPAMARPQVRAKGLAGQRSRGLSYSAPGEDGSVKTTGSTASAADDPYAGVGRNAPCPCGSGKKYKMCHGRAGTV
jgi:preprotein translocase subunit SecA